MSAVSLVGSIIRNAIYWIFTFLWRCDPTQVMASSFLRFLDHTQWHTTVGRNPLDEWSALYLSDLYLTTHNTHNRQTSMPPVKFEPTISAGERPQTYALDRAAAGTGTSCRSILMLSFYLRLGLQSGLRAIVKAKLKQSLRIPGGWGSQISWQPSHEGGKVTHRPPLPPGNILFTHFC